MGNNKEIRQRMETYRKVLLAVVWIGAVAGMIGGLIMIGHETGGWYSTNPLRPFGIALLIASIFGGIIGHFLVNVGLAIPFILLNNGDIFESLKRNLPKEDIIVEQLKEVIIDKDVDNTGNIKLIVEREKDSIYSAVSIGIFVDKKQAFSIENGSKVTCFVNDGSHSIYASLDDYAQSEIINFNTENPEITFKLILGIGEIKLKKIN